ncbi:MAG: hypothetical protein M1814_001894 [Vezdaea aestivalis]|nr:MAG: hypothetical protein M1814_001894 [Vezdaea aestivalis]
MSVEAATSAMATATIDESSKAPKAVKDEVAISAAEGRRLYIGNLAYATTQEELQEFFTEFSIESTSIPINPRTTRPVGYAFVDLASAADAEKAITDLSGKEIRERKVSVQLARKPEPEKTERIEGEDFEGADGDRRRVSGRGRGRGRGRAGRGGRGGARGPLPLTDSTNESTPAINGAEGETIDKPRTVRQPKQRGPPEDGIPSKTKVMVANLPYELSEEKLKDLFADYSPVASKIALRPIPRFMIHKLKERNEPRKGRGFGFITLATEEMQQKAIAEMNGKQIENREIAVKVAIDTPGKEDEDGSVTATNGATTSADENPEESVKVEATA